MLRTSWSSVCNCIAVKRSFARLPVRHDVLDGQAPARSEPPRGRLAMKSSTSRSTQRTARVPIRIGFGNLEAAISA